MKYLFTFLYKTTVLIVVYFFYVPRFIFRLFECLWECNFNAFKRPWRFYEADESFNMKFYYNTGWDFIMNNKIIVRNYWDEHLNRLWNVAKIKHS